MGQVLAQLRQVMACLQGQCLHWHGTLQCHTRPGVHFTNDFFHRNYISPGSQIPQVEARKRCSRDLFTSSGRATALIGRHFWYTILQQSLARLTNTAILLTYTSRFHWRLSGNWQEHICECNISCFGSPSHLSLGSDRLNVTVCRTCTVPLWPSGQSEAEVTGKISLDGWRYVHRVLHISIPPSYLV